MIKYFIYFFLLYLPLFSFGQEIPIGQMEKQTNGGNLFLADSLNALIPLSKLSLLSDVDIIFNSRFAYDSHFLNGENSLSDFNVNQFRFEIKGKINEKVQFRYRNRYTRETETGNLDNISRSIDLAFIKIKINSSTNLSIGKLVADFGGWEFDMNPIYILAFNDIINNSDNFLVGAEVSHVFAKRSNSMAVQVLNSRTKTFEEQYGATAPPTLASSKFPLAFVANWRGTFFDGKVKTTYSYSFFNEAQGADMNYIALGNRFKTRKFLLYYDFQYSYEGLDRRKVISNIISSRFQYAAQKVVYIGNWVRAEYLITPKINLLLTLMTTDFYWKDNPEPDGRSKLSTSFGVTPTIEYMPFKKFNMKFYAGYVARKYNYTRYAQASFGVRDYSTGLFSFGVIAPILVL